MEQPPKIVSHFEVLCWKENLMKDLERLQKRAMRNCFETWNNKKSKYLFKS